MDFLEKIKKELRPEDAAIKEAEKFISEINKRIKEKGIKAVCISGGSVAKGTFLKGDFDIDLFVKFDYALKDNNLSKILYRILSPYKPQRVKGSRDYFQLKREGINYEIVPVLDVSNREDAPNVTDLSPLHVGWVKKNLKKGQDDEIRLAKKFCKAIGVYGAESYVKGFSGHAIDILIIHYGSFLSLIRAATKWKAPVIIDVEKHYRSRSELLFSMNRSKISGPIILVDPIVKGRNAAAALSYEKFSLFKKKAAQFLKNPSENFFIEEKVSLQSLKKKHKPIFIIGVKARNGKRDVVGSRLMKAFRFIKSGLAKEGFSIKDSGWSWNEKRRAVFWFALSGDILPEKKIIKGPPEELEQHAALFRKKYKTCFTRDGHLYAEAQVKIRKAEELIRELANAEYFKERAAFAWMKQS